MKVLCIIPARYASTRLPGKPLADIDGKPMICRIYERAREARLPYEVLVATDSEAVLEAVERGGGKAVLTAKDHATGTDRLAEVARARAEADVIVNVQGDEPLIDPAVIDRLAAAFEEDPALQMATLKTRMTEEAEMQNPNNVKVATDQSGYALYFSRSLLPYPRNAGAAVYKHIGVYAYRRAFLLQYAAMEPTPLEQAESLEQLRALENGYKIKVLETDATFIGVDTPEDLAKVNAIYRARRNAAQPK